MQTAPLGLTLALPPGGRLSTCYASLRSCFEGYARA